MCLLIDDIFYLARSKTKIKLNKGSLCYVFLYMCECKCPVLYSLFHHLHPILFNKLCPVPIHLILDDRKMLSVTFS